MYLRCFLYLYTYVRIIQQGDSEGVSYSFTFQTTELDWCMEKDSSLEWTFTATQLSSLENEAPHRLQRLNSQHLSG